MKFLSFWSKVKKNNKSKFKITKFKSHITDSIINLYNCKFYFFLRIKINLLNLILDKKDKKEALAFLPKLNSELMKIAKTGVIKKQHASRNISRITKKINSL